MEQVPGLTVSADKTGALDRGYWPSYNVPYFPEVGHESVLLIEWQLALAAEGMGT